MLDELGATGTRIVVTSDLDEYVITALGAAPIDGFGVGTRVVTGSGPVSYTHLDVYKRQAWSCPL